MSGAAGRAEALARWQLMWAADCERLDHAQWLFRAQAIRGGGAPRGCRLTAAGCVARAAVARHRLAAIKQALAEQDLQGGRSMRAKARLRETPRGMVKIGDEARPLDAETAELLAEGWALKSRIAEAEERLGAINARLVAKWGPGAACVLAGVARATIAERQTVTIRDGEGLRAALGARFDDLVRAEVTYRPEPRLIELAASGDEALAASVRPYLTVRESTAVTWRPER